MYYFNTEHLDRVTWQKRRRSWRFRLTCGGVLLTSTFAATENDVYADSDYPRSCPACERECIVEFKNDDDTPTEELPYEPE